VSRSRSTLPPLRRALAAGTLSAVALTLFNAVQPGLGRRPAGPVGPGVVKDVKVALAADPAAAAQVHPRLAERGLQARVQAAPARPGGALVSRPVPVGKARFVGFSWPRPATGAAPAGGHEQGTVWLRTRTAAGWSGWREVEPAGDGPDPGTSEYRRVQRVFSDGQWLDAGTSELQLRVEPPETETGAGAGAATATGPGAGDLAAHLITPDMTATPGTEPARPGEATALPATPRIVSRPAWGARESLRREPPDYSGTVKAALVHHTVQSNSYSPAESAALVRADYLYHVQSRGWNDIGYNFLVDRYGRVFEGRYGGVTRPVLGAHAGGFNTDTTGVALLGTFTGVRPPSTMLAALERLLAWKLDLTHVDPRGTTVLTSRGGASARYPAGRQVRVPTITGHRSTNLTACPGDPTLALLGRIRAVAAAIGRPKIYGGGLSAASVTQGSGRPVTLRARFNPTARWDVKVTASNGAVVRHWRGVGQAAHLRWDGRTQAGRLAPPGWGTVTLTASAGSARARPVVRNLYIRRNGLPPDATTTGGFSRGRWYLTGRNVDQFSRPAFTSFAYGRRAGDRPVVGDWDGDGTHTVGVIRGNQLLLRNTNGAGRPDLAFRFAGSSDRFTFGDWDGDGTWTPAVVRNGRWYLRNANTTGPAAPSFRFGRAGDRFVVGDWNGDGIMTVGFVRRGVWYLRNSNSAGPEDIGPFRFGRATDVPYVGDWDNDGIWTPGVLRGGRRWYLDDDFAGGANRGLRKQTPGTAVVGDWDGRP
jgi:N-acetylmuramoyl-L-alanine amidase-like protein